MQQMIRELAKELRKGNTKFYFDKKRFLIVNKIFNNVDNLIKKKGNNEKYATNVLLYPGRI